uniref:F-box/LRR-repeat protein 15/At3g58940/PEG3-like LRR domain-containing protein n=1 Tax=Lactuca sativa TaxID=4236 RepID=A0A9R1XFP7_LACSA|nr:hypothetical protein LSAT_V11C500255850 [Lactuca sativa]
MLFCSNNEDVEIPHCLVTCSSLEVLKLDLEYRGLRLPNIMGFLALRVLRLSYVDLLGDGYLVKDFLENCPSLEELTLLDCVLSKLNLLCILCPKLRSLGCVWLWKIFHFSRKIF